MFRSLLVFLLSFAIAAIAVPSPSAAPDTFVLKDGVLQQKRFSAALNETWYTTTSQYVLEVLANDEIKDDPLESCVVEDLSDVQRNASASIMFKDIAKAAGITHKHRDHIATRPHCAFDFVVPFYNSSKKARLPGEFCVLEHITGGAAVGDYDGDGLQDLYFSVFLERSVLYKNLGNGKFRNVTAETGVGPDKYANGAVWVDIDQDGDLDLYVTTTGASRHYLYVNYGGVFKEEATKRGLSLEFASKRKLAGMTPNVGDYDNDGYPDIYASEWILHSLDGMPSASRLLRNLGKSKPGYFEDVTDKAGVNMDHYWIERTKYNAGTHTFGSSFTDFDNDGLVDLLITGDYGESKMFWNNGNMTFTERTLKSGLTGDQDAMGHAIGDWNNDGYLEWFSSAIFDNQTNCEVSGCMFGHIGNKFYQNLGNRSFVDVAAYAGVKDGGWAWGAAFFDFDNDGYLDIVLTNGMDTTSTTIDDVFMRQQMRLFLNYGKSAAPSMAGKTREVASDYGMKYRGMGRGLLKFDFDNDGDEDVVVAANVGPAVFYENVGGNKKNWLRIHVVHRCGINDTRLCDSYGARVIVTDPTGRKQTQEIGSSTHFLGQSEIMAHYGLLDYKDNIAVKVYWPATNQTVIVQQVKTNRVLRIVRPSLAEKRYIVKTFSEIKKCPKLKIKDVTLKPGSMFGVGISNDKQSLVLKLHPATPLHGLGLQTFHYTVQVGSETKSTAVTIDARLFIRDKPLSSMCPHGRMWLPGMPIVTKTEKRTYNGVSNNLNKLYWGKASENLRRLVPSAYQDDISMPAGACTKQQRESKTCPYPDELSGFGSNRPSPRLISNEIFAQSESVVSERGLSDLHVHYGQFFVHDMDFSSPLPRFEFQGNLNEVWMQITVPKNDPHFDQDGTGNKYLPFTRSTYNRCTGQYPNGYSREQVNKISAYIDATDVYGSSKSRCDALRAMKDGKMKLEDDGLIPKNNMSLANDNPIGRDPSVLRVAGDTRANVAPGLLTFHTLFVKEHNRLCDEYKKKHPLANDEEIFQYARRIVIAEHQAIAFREYIPATLGASSVPPYKGYNASIDVDISNVFATAAFRFGHSQVNSHFFRFDNNWNISKYGHLLLRESYFHPERITTEGGLDPLIRGMVREPAQQIDTLMSDELRNVLFPAGRHNGLDLASMNIQRGRDHGLPDFNSVRKLLGLKAYTTFAEITKNKKVATKLESLYKQIDNIDLWVGGLAEDHKEGSELGETFHFIFREGVLRVRDGDRLWYEKIMSKEEIEMVNSLTLSKIIKLNSGVKDVPYNVFFSTKHCKDVINHKCVPREPVFSPDVEAKLKTLKNKGDTLEKKLSDAKQMHNKRTDKLETKNTNLSALSGLLGGVLLVILVVIAVVVCRRNGKFFRDRSSLTKKFDGEIKGKREGNGYVLENVYASNGDASNGKSNQHIGIIA